MLDVLLIMTRKCNLQCAHCCDDCGPKGETMSWENMAKVFSNLPKETEALRLGGGEPFVSRNRLFRAVDYIREHKAQVLPQGSLSIQTNGSWAVNPEQAYQMLKRLYRGHLEIEILITGNDKFHREQGLDTSRLSVNEGSPLYTAMQRIADESGASMRKRTGMPALDIAGDGNKLSACVLRGRDKALPFGRAKALREWDLRTVSSCTMKEFKGDDYTLIIEPDGSVYPCGWCATPAIGSALESQLEELVENMRSDKVFRTLIRKGLAETARLLGTYRPEDAEAYKKNPCSKCGEVFGGRR